MAASIRLPRPLIAGAAFLSVGALAAVALFGGLPGGASATDAPASSPPGTVPASQRPSGSATTALPSAPRASATPASGFVPIDLFALPPIPFLQPTDAPGDSIFRSDPGRPRPEQSVDWRTLKASGRVALSGGKIGLLDAGADPLALPGTGALVAQARTLDLTWTRWVVEPPGAGTDAKGNTYHDLNYWNMCGPGAVTVTLYYWQKATGRPNVTGTAGYFLDPYQSAGVVWPSHGPTFASADGKANRLGTYWSGSDTVSGFTSRGRGFLMYLAMAAQPTGWTSKGIDIFADGDGKARYPTLGSPPRYMEAGLNWEVSNHAAAGWQEAYYTSVGRWDPEMARDLQAAVMIDVGRDGVPVIASPDTFYLPNWQASSSSKTPHTRHAISIVGYDNTANPPTYTYLDTCGRQCNSRGGNRNGQIHVISQAQMVLALTEAYGQGFTF